MSDISNFQRFDTQMPRSRGICKIRKRTVWGYCTGRVGSSVHSAIDPSYMDEFLLPRISERPNQATDAQWPVLQKLMFSSSEVTPTASISAAIVSGWAKRAYSAL